MQTQLPSKPVDVLVFEIGGQRYGLPAEHVQELVRAVTLAPLPQGRGTVEGVMNLRGRLVPVLDIRAHLRLPPKNAEPSDHLIVALYGNRRVAIRVDRALELARLDQDAIDSGADVVSGMEGGTQVAKLHGGLLLIHDLTDFLSGDAAAALVQGLPAAAVGVGGGRP